MQYQCKVNLPHLADRIHYPVHRNCNLFILKFSHTFWQLKGYSSQLQTDRNVWKAGVGHRNMQVTNCRFEGSSHIPFSSQLTLLLIHQIAQRSVDVRAFYLSGFHTKASKWVCRKWLWSNSCKLNYSNKTHLPHAFICKDSATLFVIALSHGIISI